MLPKSCPRCGGWTMHQSGLGLIESSCVICGWVVYRETLPWQRMVSSPRGPHATEKEIADDPEHP
jgi:hypothetical protein